MNPIVWKVRPEIISWGFLTLRWYGLLFATSFLIGHHFILKFFQREKIPTEQVDRLLVFMVVGVVGGARLGHCLFYEPEIYLANPLRILAIWEGGLASHGAIAGIFISIWLFSRKFKALTFLGIMDRLAVPAAIGAGFIRLGNLFNSEIVGKPTHLPWAFVFPSVDQVPRHPTQIYESLCYFAVFFVLYRMYLNPKIRNQPGRISGACLGLIFTARFILEFFKENQVSFESQLPLDMGQLLSIPIVAIAIYLFVRRQHEPAK